MKKLVRRLGLREKEINDSFIVNEQKIQALMTDKEKMKLSVADLIVFKDKAEDLIGIELESFIQYLINNQDKSKHLVHLDSV